MESGSIGTTYWQNLSSWSEKHVNIFNFIARKSIEHRILYLLDFKRSVFEGVIEEEGQDSVMLESFLESVKALTEINVDPEEDAEFKAQILRQKYNNDLADENNKAILEKYSEVKVEAEHEKIQTKPIIKKEKVEKDNSIFARIKSGLHTFLKRFKR